MAIQTEGLADHLRIAVEVALPEAVADDRDGAGRTSAMTVVHPR